MRGCWAASCGEVFAMNIVVLEGVLSSTPVTRQLASGSVVISLELTTDIDGVTASVPVAWFDPPSAVEWDAGQQLVVAGAVRRRFFRSGGLTQSRTEVVATEVVEASKRRQVQRVVRKVAEKLGAQLVPAVRST